MPLSSLAQHAAPSATLALNAKAKRMAQEGQDVVMFTVGEPDFDTPENIKQAAVRAIQSGHTKYTPAAGTMELRRAVADKLNRDNGLDCAPDLRVDEVRVEQPVAPLEPADVRVVVWNRGVSGTGRGFRVALTSDGGLGYEWTIPPLPPRARATLDGFLVVLDDCALSSIDVTVVVDADDVVSEGCEANNSMTVSVVVGAIEEATP